MFAKWLHSNNDRSLISKQDYFGLNLLNSVVFSFPLPSHDIGPPGSTGFIVQSGSSQRKSLEEIKILKFKIKM